MSKEHQAFCCKVFNQECSMGMKEHIPDESIDFVVTSPPYDYLRKYGGYVLDWKSVFKELYRVIKPGGVIVWNVYDQTVEGSKTGTSLDQGSYAKSIGLRIHDYNFYRKKGLRYPDTSRYWSTVEFVFILSKGAPKTVNLIMDKPIKYRRELGDTQKTRNADGSLTTKEIYQASKEFGVREHIFSYSPVNGQSDERAWEHPAVFPEPFAGDQIRTYTNEWDIVLDPFAGSFTTQRMAKRLNRHYTGFEISEEFWKNGNIILNDTPAGAGYTGLSSTVDFIFEGEAENKPKGLEDFLGV